MPIGTCFGEEALKREKYACTAIVASRGARLLSISVADYITQFCDGVAPVRTSPNGSDAEGQELLNASETSSSDDVPANAPARVRIFAKKKCYTKVRGQVQEMTKEVNKRRKCRADVEALQEEHWQELQPRRTPRRVAPPVVAAPRPHSSALLHNQGHHECSGVDGAGETGVLDRLKAPSRVGARSSARKTPPTALPRCSTASTCAPPPSVVGMVSSVSPTRPSTSGTSMPSPKGSMVGGMPFAEVDTRKPLPLMVSAWEPADKRS